MNKLLSLSRSPRMRAVLLLLVALLSSGCLGKAVQCDHTAHLSTEEAISIANRAAADSDYDLARYGPPEAHFEYVDQDCTWSVFYKGMSDRTGNHFLVVVGDRTGKAKIFGGL